MSTGGIIGLAVVALLVAITVYDLLQTQYAILRNFPVIGHFRYLLQAIGPELRQYIVTSNDEELPFSRDQRTWVYASAKKENNYFGFGTDNDLENASNYLVIKHAAFYSPPDDLHAADGTPQYRIPCAKVLGAARGRAKAFRPQSIINVSAMSYGSLSAPAVHALNKGCALSECLHNTGEGGISPHHEHGGGLIWQLGTGYFGARDSSGKFSLDVLREKVDRHNVKAIEVKLSQGAKPGKGGVLPAAKITKEISAIRGIPMGVDCISPSYHSAFGSADELLDFVESIADATGLPVGIKSAVGELNFWTDLADLMAKKDRGVDYIQIDGGEGGTGAAPLVFADHVSLPFKIGFSRVFRAFAERDIQHDLVWIGSGKLGFPQQTALATAMGCDMVAIAREAMLAIGCIQAQRCHTGHCPAGIATHNKWLIRGLEPTSKAARFANFAITLRKEVLWLCHAMGVTHPAELTLDHFELLDDGFGVRHPAEVFKLQSEWALPGAANREAIDKIMRGQLAA